jgi:hypothetical protein
MANYSASRVALALALVAVTASGCHTTAGKPATAEPAATPSAVTTTTASPIPVTTAPSETAATAPTGQPIGTATMQVSGGTGPVTIRYQINGGAEQTEANATLPWQKQYPVYNEISSSVTADGGDTGLVCSIIMDGKLAAFQSQSRPTCSFAYYH